MDLSQLADRYWEGKDDSVDRRRLRAICSLVPRDVEILVVDAGPGFLPLELLARGCGPVVMTDLSRVAIERAKARGLDAHLANTDAESLPFSDGRFPCVISDSALEHRYDPWRGLAECARVLAPEGTLILTLPNVAHWRHRLQLFIGRFPEVEGGPTDRSHLRMFAMPQMKAMARAAGLRVRSVRGYASLWVKGLYPALLRVPPLSWCYPALVRARPSLFARDLFLVCTKDAAFPR